MKKRIKRLLFIAFVLNCVQMNIYSQSAFSINMEEYIIIGLTSLGIGIIPFFINNEPTDISGTFNKNEVNIFDRSLIFLYNKYLDYFSDYYLSTALAILPVISVIPGTKNSKVLLSYGVMYTESLLLTYGTVFSLKGIVDRYRPYMYDSGVPDAKKNDYHNSFPSSATAFAFLGVTFFTTTYSHEFPESKWKTPLIIGGYTLAASVGAMRILAGSHFLTDVFAGAAIGSLYGWLIPWLHLEKENNKFAVIPTMNGIMFSMKI
jgi:membrane-associated phospholipid phosphatase